MSLIAPLPLAWPPVDVDCAASLLSCDPLALLDEARELHACGVDWLHVDIMDDHFVPNFGITPRAAAELVARQPLPIDVHLMVERPLPLIDKLAQAGVSIITVHADGQRELGRTLSYIRAQGVRVGVALSPTTPVHLLEEVAHSVDVVLVMSVHPGFAGQRFLPSTLSKLRRTRALLERAASHVVLAVDGGIGTEEAFEVCREGARMLVVGQTLASSSSRQEALDSVRTAGKKGLREFYRSSRGAAQGMEGNERA